MKSRKSPLLLAVVGAIVAAGLFVVLRDDGDQGGSGDGEPVAASQPAEEPRPEKPGPEKPGPEKPAVPVIEIVGGEPKGGVREIELTKGERIRFIVQSDVAEEVHLHGYDVSKDVSAGGKVSFDLPATIDGAFEVELESAHVPIAQISVLPG